MAVESFIPEVWAAELLVALQDRHVFAQGGIVNRNYEGEIANSGDTVRINSLTDPTIGNYVKNVTVINPQTLATTDQTMVIDQAKYFAFEIDDVDARQVANDGALMSEAVVRSANGLVQAVDTHIGTTIAANGSVLPADSVATADAAYLLMRNIKLKLDKANVPTDGRFLVVSPEFHALILGDNRFVDASRYGTNDAIMRGEIGQAIGFRLVASNNLPAGATSASRFVIAGHAMATTFAEQINKVEAFRPESSFSDAVKGLHLYGSKVVRPEAVVAIDLTVTVA